MDSIVAQAQTRPWWYWFYQPYKWLVFFPIAVLTTAFFAFVVMIMAPIFGPRIAGYNGPIWARLLVWLTPARVIVAGREHVQRGQSYVIVANHLSMFDILALYGWLGVDFRWVLKQELRKVPAIGIGCQVLGHVFINRADSEAARAAINAARETVSGGTCILFFPEGTRSTSGSMLPFKKGAFRLAVDLDLPVLPVTLKGTNRVCPNKTLDIVPGTMELVFHPPIKVEGVNRAVQLRDRARAAIASAQA